MIQKGAILADNMFQWNKVVRSEFALFDFDEAYNDWNGPQHNRIEIEDPFQGLAKQLMCEDHFALLLPVPPCEQIRRQTLNEHNQPWGGIDCHLSIELLFYETELENAHFKTKQIAGGGEIGHRRSCESD